MIETLWEINLICWEIEAICLLCSPILWLGWMFIWIDRWPSPPNFGQQCKATLANVKKAQKILGKVRPGMMVALPENSDVHYDAFGNPRIVMRPTQPTWQ